MVTDSVSLNFAGAAGYVPCTLPDIERALNRLFSDLQGAGDSYTKAVSTNVLVPVGSAAAVEHVESLVEELARLHPSRFFILGFDDSVKKVTAQVTARCHLMGRGPDGKSQHVCSEVVRLAAPSADTLALAEVLRANLVIGTPTELVLFDSSINEKLFKVALSLCDSLFLDSSMLGARPALLELLRQSALPAVDLQWIALGGWRDQVKAAFDLRPTLGLARGLERIEIISDKISAGSAMPMATLLLAGWFASRLGLEARNVAASGSEDAYTFDCISAAGSTVRLAFSSSSESQGQSPEWFGEEGSVEPKVRSVLLQGIVRGGKQASVKLERKGKGLEASIRGESSAVMSRPLEEEGALARLKRYFLVGESTLNYACAMTKAIAFSKLLSEKGR